MSRSKNPDIKELLKDVVDATSNCFSILVGKRCRCSIKEVSKSSSISTVVRDKISSIQSSDTSSQAHLISENTDFENIWYGQNGCVRYFLSNNLKSLWNDHRYRNSSFKQTGEPKKATWGIFSTTHWPLQYNSSIVWPIRYLPDQRKWPVLNEAGLINLPPDQRPYVWGFLCVDCKSAGVFDEVHAPELGAAIADAIFTILEAHKLQKSPNPAKPRNNKPVVQQTPIESNVVTQSGETGSTSYVYTQPDRTPT